jgi:putative transcriptional regulator
MGTDGFDGLLSGLTEILTGPAGKPIPEPLPARTDRLPLPDTIDVAAIRARTGLSHAALASRIGVRAATLRNWENGARDPKGPATVLLALLSRNPRIIDDTLSV